MPTTLYSYRDRNDRCLYRVVRHHPKRFELVDGAGGRIGAFPDRTVLYRLPELMAADRKEIVYVTEGEKDADRLADMGLVATTNPGGCRVGWKDEYSACLKGRFVVVLADNDRPGAKHAEKVERALFGVAGLVAVLKLPRLKRAEDVSDWLDFRNGTLDELVRRAEGLLKPGRSVRPPEAGGHNKRHAVFTSRTLSPSERLLLLALVHHAGEHDTPPASQLARETGMHRVSVQRLIAALTGRSILRRTDDGNLTVCWERIV